MEQTYTERQRKIASAMGINPQAAVDLPERIKLAAFFQTLSKHGINVDSDEQALQLIAASDQVEAKRAEFAAAAKRNSPVNRALELLSGKKAGAPQAKSANPLIGEPKPAEEISKQAQMQLSGYLSDPATYGALVVALSETE